MTPPGGGVPGPGSDVTDHHTSSPGVGQRGSRSLKNLNVLFVYFYWPQQKNLQA